MCIKVRRRALKCTMAGPQCCALMPSALRVVALTRNRPACRRDPTTEEPCLLVARTTTTAGFPGSVSADMSTPDVKDEVC